MRVGIAISSFRSDDDVIGLLEKIISEFWPFEGIIIVDSLGEGKIQNYIIRQKLKNIEYYNFNINLGSAGNLKERLSICAEKDWDFVLALNHDALVSKFTYLELLRYTHMEKLGAIYPLRYYKNKNFYDYSGTSEVGPWRSFGKKTPTKNHLIPCQWSSSNGALYSLTPVRKGLVPNKDLWMGWEDYLYGLDLKKSGYEQYIASNAICDDNYEFKEKRIGFSKIIMAFKPDWYDYYNTRNLWLICLFYHPSLMRIIRVLLRTILQFFVIIFLRSSESKKYILILTCKGILDSLRKITGKKDI